MADAELKDKIIEWFESKKEKQQKMYVSAVTKQFSDIKKREVKTALKELVDDERLAYWSSGSTTYVMLKSIYDQLDQ